MRGRKFWFSCLIINCFFFYIGLKCHFNYFVLHIYTYICIYVYVVDVVALMKTAGVVENSGHCIYSTGLKYF